MTFFSNIELLTYIPIGIIGVWRWTVWGIKKIGASQYKPKAPGFSAKVSLITPVYNEDPDAFKKSLDSWAKEKPTEIIAVIDHTDNSSIKIFEEFQQTFKNAKLVVTTTPGKREALANGIKKAKYEIVALVDSDTAWTEGTLINALAPFSDPKIGGVATRQNVVKPDNLTRILFDIQLDLRYFDEMPFLSAWGNALSCLSGRTAFYRKTAVKPVLKDLLHETFWGRKVISGDDKRLTYLVQAAGWKTYYQQTAVVLTPGTEDFKTFQKQRIRWARNSWRADMKVISSMWMAKHPTLTFFIIDRFFTPFTLMLGLAYLINSIVFGDYTAAVILLSWWMISRTIKIYPHLKRYPKNILHIPAYTFFSYWAGILKIFSLVTLNAQGWLTRWDLSRMKKVDLIQTFASYAYTFYIIAGIWYFSYTTYTLNINPNENLAFAANLREDMSLAPKDISGSIDNLNHLDTSPSLVRHEVKGGDTLNTIAEQYKIPVSEILKFNFPILPNWDKINPGDILTIPVKAVKYEPLNMFNFQRKHLPIKEQWFDSATNTIHIAGRGHKFSLTEIAEKDGFTHLSKESDGVWLLKSSLYLENGTSLTLASPEVSWLKMQSNAEGEATIIGYNTRLTIRDTKITSWDPSKNGVDMEYKDGRSYILVRANSRMDIYNSELSYLGFKDLAVAGGTYGVSWRIPSRTFPNFIVTGEVLNSNFHHNYFGAYTYGATGIVWRDNKFNDNVVYGLDPHDDSNNFIVENNTAERNGTHGIIFSKRCFNNIIVNNRSLNNVLHGIMLHQDSNDNIVRNNYVEGNKDGIAIYASSGNLIQDNIVKNSKSGIRINEYSKNNYVINNEVTGSTNHALFVYGNSNENIFRSNKLFGNTNATYIKTESNEISFNTIENNKTAIYLLDSASNNTFISNNLNANEVPTKIKTTPDKINFYKLTNLLSSNN